MIEMVKLMVLYQNRSLDQCEYKIRSIRRLFKENNCPFWLQNIFNALTKVIELDCIQFPASSIQTEIIKKAIENTHHEFKETELEFFPFHYYLQQLMNSKLNTTNVNSSSFAP